MFFAISSPSKPIPEISTGYFAPRRAQPLLPLFGSNAKKKRKENTRSATAKLGVNENAISDALAQAHQSHRCGSCTTQGRSQ